MVGFLVWLTWPCCARWIKWLPVITNINLSIQTVVDFQATGKWAADDEVSESTQRCHIICECQISSETKVSVIVSDDKSISHLSKPDGFYPSTAKVKTSSDLNSSVMYREAKSGQVHSPFPEELPRYDLWWLVLPQQCLVSKMKGFGENLSHSLSIDQQSSSPRMQSVKGPLSQSVANQWQRECFYHA